MAHEEWMDFQISLKVSPTAEHLRLVPGALEPVVAKRIEGLIQKNLISGVPGPIFEGAHVQQVTVTAITRPFYVDANDGE